MLYIVILLHPPFIHRSFQSVESSIWGGEFLHACDPKKNKKTSTQGCFPWQQRGDGSDRPGSEGLKGGLGAEKVGNFISEDGDQWESNSENLGSLEL